MISSAPASAIGAGAAVAVLVAIPLLLTPTATPAPTPAEGQLTVELSGTAGDADPYELGVRGPSPPPAQTDSTVLRDTTGQHTATIAPQPGGCGTSSERVAFSSGGDLWCLPLSGIPAGHELAAKVKNASGDALSLTVRRRDGFAGLPLAVLLLGLASGLAVAVVPNLLRGVVRWLVLTRLTANATPGTSGQAPKIQDVADWVKQRRTESISTEKLIAAVDHVSEDGGTLASRARERLQTAIDDANELINTDHEFLTKAEVEAKSDSLRMQDFYTHTMEPKSHPANEWGDAVVKLVAYRVELNRQKITIDGMQPGDAGKAIEALATAEERFKQLETPEDLSVMPARLDAVRLAIDEGLASARQRDAQIFRGGTTTPADWTSGGALLSVFERAVPIGSDGARLGHWIWVARAVTVLLGLTALVYAFLTIKQSTYDAKPLFHAWSDYLTLFSAALASGASATVLALVGNWSTAGDGSGGA